MSILKKLWIVCLCLSHFVSAETEFATPKPSIDHPRQIVFSIDSNEDKVANHVLSTVNNVIKFYRPENTEVVVVVYSQGLKILLKKGESEIRKRIEALMLYDIEFIACENTMRTLGITKKELLPDIGFGTAGIVEIIERQLRGVTYIKL